MKMEGLCFTAGNGQTSRLSSILYTGNRTHEKRRDGSSSIGSILRFDDMAGLFTWIACKLREFFLIKDISLSCFIKMIQPYQKNALPLHDMMYTANKFKQPKNKHCFTAKITFMVHISYIIGLIGGQS